MLDFPLNPVAGQKYTSSSDALYMFDGNGWIQSYMLRGTSNAPVLSAVPHLTTSPYPPTNPAINDLWYSTISGFLFLWYNDGNTIQWVVANPGIGTEQGPQGPIGATGTIGPQGAQGPPGPAGPTGDQTYARVESYGGGNGLDDSVAFTAALADGRVIALDSRTIYKVNNVIIPLESPCPGIVSLGGRVRIQPIVGATAGSVFFIVNKVDGFTFDNLFFDMPVTTNPAGSATFNRAIVLQPTTGKRGRNYLIQNCSFSGADNAVSGVDYIIEDSNFDNNYITGTFNDAFVFNSMINCSISDNLFESCCLSNNASATSGVIRTGTDDQLDVSLNLIISRNTITNCTRASLQSAIDCFSGAARNIRITNNTLNDNGAGIELKTQIWDQPTPPPAGAEDFYGDNVVAGNTIRMLHDVTTNAITVFHATAGSPKGKAANLRVTDNNISCKQPVAVGVVNHYAISIRGHDNVLVDGNFIFGAGRGISIGGIGPVGDVSDYIVVSNNTVDVVQIAFHHTGGTLNHLYIRNNPLLRVGAGVATPAVAITSAGTDIEVSGNRIQSFSVHALEISTVSNVLVADNILVSATVPVVSLTPGSTSTKYRDNDVIGGTGPGFNLTAGSSLEIQGNNIDVPITSTTATGAAPYLAANNIRGLRTTIPTGVAAGTLGDIFLDATAATAGWRCTSAGSAAGAVWTVI